MKTVALLLLLGITLTLSADSQLSSGGRAVTRSASTTKTGKKANAQPSITERGPNYRVWTRMNDIERGSSSRSKTNRVVELATGMHYWDGRDWVTSDPGFVVTANGFVAFHTQHKVQLNRNIAVQGAVSVTTRDGVRLRSTPLGIGLYDAASGNFLLIAQITNSIGYLVGSNQVVYPDAFSGVCADVVYTMKNGSFHQDILFTGQLDPTAYGFPRETTRIQILTEFYDDSHPKSRSKVLHREKSDVIRKKMVSPDLIDQTLGFGEFVLGPGSAFSVSQAATINHQSQIGPSVAKAFIPVNNRRFLVESADYHSVSNFMAGLPPCGNGGSSMLKIEKAESAYALLPVINQNTATQSAVSAPVKRVAAAKGIPPGFVIDYTATIGGTIDDGFIFQSDTTYFLSDSVTCSGTAILEGGTVVKYGLTYLDGDMVLHAPQIQAVIDCEGSMYRPIVLTGSDDDSVGESTAGIDLNYTGSPTQGEYEGPYLNIANAQSLGNMRINFAGVGLFLSNPSEAPFEFDHMQFLNCRWSMMNLAGDEMTPLTLNNCLMANDETPFFDIAGAEAYSINHCTFDSDVQFESTQSGGSGSFAVTNSVFANMQDDWTAINITGDFNGFYNNYNGETFGNDASTVGSTPFQPVGAGNYYLASGTFQGLGTTNLDPQLLAALAKKTTYPPYVIFSSNICADLTLAPAIPRDTNSLLDLGYHYDPIDYAVGAVLISNATLTVISGTAIATFDTNASGWGMFLGPGGQLICQGSPNNLCQIINFNTVQESFYTNWQTPNASLIKPGYTAEITCRFTDFSMLAQQTSFFFTTAALSGPPTLQDCQVHGGFIFMCDSIDLTNCLFDRVNTELLGADGNTLTIRNTLFLGGYFELDSYDTNAVVQNNLFDGTVISDDGGTVGGWNAYVTNFSQLALSYVTDVILTNSLAYQPGPLGNYYQPSDSPLIDAGNTNAGILGLYHYTTQTNQIEEGNSTVDIGYHYVAVDGNGNLIDANNNGTPDYLESPNGPVPPTITIQPASHVASAGDNVTFAVVAAGDPAMTYQWQLNGANITGATLSSYTTNNVQLGDDGVYAAIVSNSAGSMTSSNASLTVVSFPAAGLQFWIRADAGVVTNATGGVQLWRDLSGNGNDATQSNLDLQPQWVGNASATGQPAVHFTATNSTLLQFNAFLTNQTPAEAYVVLRVVTNAPDDDRGLWRIGELENLSGTDNRFTGQKYAGLSRNANPFNTECGIDFQGQTLYPAVDGSINDDFASAVTAYVGVPAQPLTSFHLYNVISTQNGWTNRINGILLFATVDNSIQYDPDGSLFYLGLSQNKYFDGDIAELLIFTNALSATDRVAVGTYLNQKYGLVTSTLPAPTDLTVTALSPSQISVYWTSSLSNTPFCTLERSMGDTNSFVQIATVENAQSYIDTNLSANTQYYYRVRAFNYAGVSSYSINNGAMTLFSGTPFPLGDLQFWLRGDAGHQSETGVMPVWLDQSGNGDYAYQMDSISEQPTATNAALNGRTAVHFNATNNNFMYFDPPDFLSGNNPAEAFLILRAVSATPDSNRGLWGISGQSYYPDTSGNIQDSFGSSTVYNAGQPVQSITNFHVYNVAAGANGWSNRLNGVAQFAANNNTVSYSPSLYEYSLGGSPAFDGDIAEVMIFDRTLTDAERVAVGVYLQSRYGISSTPALPPTGVLALAVSPTELVLTMTGSVSNCASLTIERKTGAGGAYSQIANLAAIPPGGVADFISSSTIDYYYRFTAYDYAGNSTNLVIAPPTISIASPASSTPESAGPDIHLSVSAADPDGSVAEVDLYNHQTIFLGGMTNSPYNFTVASTNSGYLGLTAKATDNNGNTRISTLVNLPIYPNTSGDGRNNGLDILLGLDPSTNSAPPLNPADTSPPIINLLIPTNAVPVP